MAKMELFCAVGGPLAKFSPRSCLGLLFLAVAQTLLANGQSQVSVSLMFRGEVLPNDSIVDIDDIMYTDPQRTDVPSNRNPRDEALKCVTDLVDCCGTEPGTTVTRTVRGNWYPDVVTLSNTGGQFRVNRGPNEVLSDGSQVYGSVRLYRHFTPPQRGRYCCELPSAANPSVNQTLCAIILQFGFRFYLDHVIISPSTGSATAGQTGYSLTCSSTLLEPSRLPSDLPSLNFQWSFNGGASLPSGVTATPTVVSSSNSTSETYSSDLQFSSPLSQSLHTGMYACRLGPGRLVNSAMVTVNAPPITAMVTANLKESLMVGQTGNTLTCNVSGADNLNPTITYQWTRNDQPVPGATTNTFNFSPLRLSQAGVYTCSATVGSSFLSGDINANAGNPQTVMIQIPNPQSVAVTAYPPNHVFGGSTCTVTVNCTVVLHEIITTDDLPLLDVSAQISRNGNVLMQTSQSSDGTTYNFGATVNYFCESDVGNYTCTATVTPLPSSNHLTGMGQQESLSYVILIGTPATLPTQLPSNAGCYSGNNIAIAVVVSLLIECLLAAPIITAVWVFCWKRNQRPPHYKSDTTALHSGEVNQGEVVYEEPDKTAAATIAPGKFKLTECPAYAATTSSTLQQPG